MFDKIQSTYFKRVTTGVLALFMTASSGFSYAVPVYAEEVTTAAAKRKKEEEFSSTESSTLQLNENSTKEEVKKSKEESSTNTTTETKKLINDGIKETINKAKNQSSRPQEKISENADQNNSSKENSFREIIKNEKESGRKLSDQKAQENLTNIMDRKQYTFDKIVQNILEINDFSYYSKLTKDDISFLMNGTSIQDYEIVELLALKSAVFYDSCGEKKEKLKDFYSGVAKYLNLIDECKNQKKSLTRKEKQKIEDECLSIMNVFYNEEVTQWKTQKNFQDYLTANLSKNKKIYYDQMLKYIEDDELSKDKVEDMKNDQTTLKKSSGKNSSKSDEEIELPEYTEMYNQESWSNGFSIDTSELINSLRTANSVKTSGYCYLKIDETNTNFGGKGDSKIKINVSYNKSDNHNKALTWNRLRDSATTWRVSIDSSSSGLANNHGISIPNRVTTKKDNVKNDSGKYSYFVFPFQVTYKQPQYYKLCNNSEGGPTDYLDRETNNIRLNFDDYDRPNNGDSSLTYGLVKSDTPRTVTYQVNAAFFGVKTYNGSYLKHPTGVLRYMRPKYRMDVNGLLDGTESGDIKGYGKYNLKINGSVEDSRKNLYDTWEEFYYGTPYSIENITTDNDNVVYKGPSQGNISGTIWGDTNIRLEFNTAYRLDVNGRLNGGSIQSNTNGMGTFDVFVNGTQIRWSDRDAWDMIDKGATVEIKNIKADSGIHYSGNSTISFTMNGDKTDGNAIILDFTSGSTLSIDPNGGTYKGSSGVTTVNNLSPGATITVDSPTRPGYKFGGYDTSHGDYQYFASNNGWTTSHGENVGTYSRSFDGNVSLNEAPDGGYYRTNHVWRGIDSATDNYNCISFPTYTAQAGHTYKISGEVWISERPSGGSFALNFYHGDSSNDWKHCMWGISEGWTGKWVKFSMERTFDTTTNDARFEIWTSNLKGLTGNISFWLQGLKITDETTGNDVSMTKIAMGNSDIKLTARWIPLHSTLSYDAQGGSLDSVKSTDNPNNYKIVDNGAYFIQSGLNTSRYLHQRTNGQLNLDNATDVLTWNGYSSDSKQTLWTFERYKNTPYYYIINNFNGKALNLSGDGPDDLSGKPVELWKQYDANNEDNSDFLWYFKDTGDGYVNIYNKMTNKALDITNGEDADGVVLQQYTPNGTASQKFKLVNYSQVYFPTREKYANNNIYINSATPVKKGCKFLGWNTKEDGSGKTYQPGNLYDVNQDGGNVTLYAQWEKEKYTATVKLNGGSYNGSTKDFTISKYPGEEISIGAPTRSKHNFTGYKLTMDNNDGDAPTSVTQSASGFKGIMQMGNFTLNAQWTPWKHTVRYDANAGNDASVKGIPASQSKTANVDIKLSSGVPTRNGYTFLGWNTQANGKGTAYAAGAIYKNDQNGGTVTLYAQWTPWKHVLHYNKNVPTSSTSQTVSNMPVDQTKTFGQFMAISNLVPTRKGYTFAGWYTQSNGTGTKYDPGSNYAADQNGGTVNLYAKWTPWTYNIKYDQNVKSTSSSKTVTDMPAAQTKTQEIDVTLSSMTPKRNGYIFAGWSTSANGSVEYKPGSRFTKDLDSNGASITLYAVWTPWKHTIHYNSNIPTNAPTGTTTVSNMPGDQTKTFDEKLMISSNKPTRKGYNFAGWSTSANGNVVYQPGAEYKNDQNGGTVTLYAKWTAWKHTVTYDKNVPANSKKTDVKNMPGNQTKIYDQNLTLQSNVPTRIGYTFVKWTTNKDGTGTAYQPGSQYSYNRDSDGGTVTLYAVWTPWKYTVRYDKNVPANSSSQTVSNMPADQTKTEEVNLTLSSNKPSRNGYIFNGWQAQINGKAVDYQPGATLSYDPDVKGSVITLKAKWTAWKHTIHYDKNVPASSKKTNVTNMPGDQVKVFDTALSIQPMVPKRTGYTFKGWSTTANGKAEYQPGNKYNHDQNDGTVTLYAVWTPWKYKVQYDKNVSADSSSQTVSNMPTDQTKTEEVVLTLSSNKPSRNGYIFNGWQAQINGKAVDYQPGAKLSYDVDDKDGSTIILKAQWTPWKHTVHYDKNVPANSSSQTVTNMPEDQTKTFDEKLNLSTKIPKREGYNFVGWLLEYGTAIAVVSPGTAYERDQNGGTYVLKAQWEPWKHTVHYDANGGDQSSVPNDQKKTYEQNMNVATKVPTRNEYKFLGWKAYHEYNDKSGNKHSELIGNYQPGASYNYDIDETGQYAADNGEYNKCGTVTMKAQWVQLYTVKYDGNQPAIKGVTVTGSVANQTQGQDESVNLQNNNFKNNSGIFKDWSVGQDAYKYAVKSGTFRKYIHPEGYGTKHSTMTQELKDYTKDANEVDRTLVRN